MSEILVSPESPGSLKPKSWKPESWRSLFESEDLKKLELSYRQRAFIKAYVQTGNGTHAAIEAGYSAKGAGVQAHRLLRLDKVQKALDYILTLFDKPLEEPVNEKLLGSFVKAIEELEIMALQKDVVDRRPSDQIKALDLLLRYLQPFLVNVSSTDLPDNIEVSFRSVDKEVSVEEDILT